MSIHLTDVTQPQVNVGTIRGQTCVCHYSVLQPAATQWVAIGVVKFEGDGAPCLIVESGMNVETAIASLRSRVATRDAQQPQSPVPLPPERRC